MKLTAMVSTVRLLIPDKKGIYKRITAAIQEAGGQIKHSRLKKQMRGMSEAEIDITYVSGLFLVPILAALGRVPGVALLGSSASARGVISVELGVGPGAAALRDKSTPDTSP